MGANCCGLVTNATDPTRTLTLRKRFQREFGRRFRWLRGQIRDEVDKHDGFGLRTNRFVFERSDAKAAAFVEWLRQQVREGVLEVREGTPMRAAASQWWGSTYIRSAYQRGISDASSQMRGAGAQVEQRWVDSAFHRDIHADRAGLAFIRAYEELEGITDAMSQQISRELADGLAQGKHPRDIADRINNRVDKVGLTRARTLAQTEVISAHAEAQLNTFTEARIEGVQVVAEHSTAGDANVCEICEPLEGQTYSIEEARGRIPVHPNCRCTFRPVIENGREIELR